MGRYPEFITRLRTLLSSGAELRAALEMLAARPSSSELAAAVLARVGRGGTLADGWRAMEPPPPPAHAAIVDAAERSGKLIAGLDRILEEIARRQETRREIGRRLAYPAAVLVLAAILPPLHLLVSGAVGEYVWAVATFVAPLLAASVVALAWVRRGTGQFARRLEHAALALPVARSMLLNRDLGEALWLLGTLLGAGLSFADSLPLAAGASRLAAVRDALLTAATALSRGSTFGNALARSTVVPEKVASRAVIAEKAGTLDAALRDLGSELSAAAWHSVQILLRLLPVIVYVAVGAIVLSRALSVFQDLPL